MHRQSPSILFLSLAIAATPFAHADTLFNLAATFSNGDTAAGTLDLDTTAGLILGGSATISTAAGGFVASTAIAPGPPAMGIQRGRGSFDALLVYETANPLTAPLTAIQLDLPTTTLAGYAGSSIVVNGNYSNLVFPGELPFALTSGSVTPAPPSTVTPEPSSLLLLGTGLLSLAMSRRRA